MTPLDRLAAAVAAPPTILDCVYAVLCDLVDNGLDPVAPVSAAALLADLLSVGGVPAEQWPPEIAAAVNQTVRPAA